MNIRFYDDPVTRLPHIYNHEVSESEVEEIFYNPHDDYSGSENSRIAVGQTNAGRYLKVVYTRDPMPNSIFVITALEPSDKQIKAFRRGKRRRRKI